MSRVTVNVNGLSLVHEDSGGLSTATLPDVCLTPPAGAPVPYANVARSRDLASGSSFVRVDGGNRIAIVGSIFARSAGDEAGSRGGVVSGVTGKEASWLSHSFDVAIEGKGACRLTDKMLHNRGNTIDCAGVVQAHVPKKRDGKGRGKGKTAHGHETQNHRLEVIVVDAKTKAAIEGARIHLHGPGDDVAALSNATGKHLFKKLDRGRIAIVVTHPCYPDKSSVVLLTRSSQSRTVRLDPTKLKDVAHARGVELGARGDIVWAGNPATPIDAPDAAILPKEFHGGVIGTFWSSRCPDLLNANYPAQPIVYDFAESDCPIPALTQNDLWVMGTPLVWDLIDLTPQWARRIPGIRPKKGDKNANSKKQKHARQEIAVDVLKDFIARVMGRYPQVSRWVLFNEMMRLKYDGGTRSHPFWKAFGLYEGEECTSREVMAEIFRFAHEQNKNAVLIINDYDMEGWDGGKSARGERGRIFYELVNWLVDDLSRGPRRVPRKKIAVGFQMHVPETDKSTGSYRQDYRPASIRKQVARFKKIGVEVIVTEIGVQAPGMGRMNAEEKKAAARTPPVDEATFVAKNKRRYEALYRAQGKRYQDLYRALLDGDNCHCITTWGVLDGMSQFDHFGYLLDSYFGCAPPGETYYRKPSYFGALTAMHEFVK